ncbi:MAG: PEP-CTERM sorting domain-containing protein [Phycisphaerae bacterium]|nr:PEP-CTERM sorting domain-containing protein [Phycisphaerae bacterium]
MERKLKDKAMKTKVITILAAAVILFFTASELTAVEDKIFTSSGQILEGEEWSNVYIYNDDTIVDMLGGDVDGIGTYDASTVNVSGGHVNTIDALEYSTANISGGFVYGLHAKNNSIVNFSDGASGVSIGAGDFGKLNMYDGTTDLMGVIDSGTINLYGGLITESLGAWNDSVVNIYGYDFNYDPMGGSLDGGQLTGFWLDSTAFTIDLYGTETYSHINLIPEPSTLVLFAIGFFLIKRKT